MIENVKFKVNTMITIIQLDKMGDNYHYLVYLWNSRPGYVSFYSV